SKRMEECSVFLIPVFKFNTQLKRGAGFFDEVNFVDTQREVKRADAGNGRLTNTHSANLLRLNQGNCGCFFLEETGQTCRRHPAGSTPADNDNIIYLLIIHELFSSRFDARIKAYP